MRWSVCAQACGLDHMCYKDTVGEAGSAARVHTRAHQRHRRQRTPTRVNLDDGLRAEQDLVDGHTPHVSAHVHTPTHPHT